MLCRRYNYEMPAKQSKEKEVSQPGAESALDKGMLPDMFSEGVTEPNPVDKSTQDASAKEADENPCLYNHQNRMGM